MNNRTIVLASAAITVFLVVTVAALIGRLSQVPLPAAASGAQADALASDGTLETLLQEREVARQRLEEANARLRQAAQQQATLQQENDRLRQLTGETSPPDIGSASTTLPVGPVDEATAIAIAEAYAGGAPAKKVEREREHGLETFEVKFDDGSEVYVDAMTGEIAYAKAGDDEDDD